MNWLLVVVAAVFLLFALQGYHRGLIKSILSFFSLVITLVFVSFLSPYISNFFIEHTSVYESVKETCEEVMKPDEDGGSGSSNLPAFLQDTMAETGGSELLVQGEDIFYDYAGGYLAKLIINAVAYVISFSILLIILKNIMSVLNIISKLPVINGINKLAGLLLGLVQGLLIVWIGFLVITIFSNQGLGRTCYLYINDSAILTLLYECNPILKLILGFIS